MAIPQKLKHMRKIPLKVWYREQSTFFNQQPALYKIILQLIILLPAAK